MKRNIIKTGARLDGARLPANSGENRVLKLPNDFGKSPEGKINEQMG